MLRLDPPPGLTVAGRTDAGVHARGQVCHADLPDQTWATARARLVGRLAGVLPADVRVRRVVEAPPGFDARFAAVSRRYVYRLVDDPAAADPLRRQFVVAHPRPLDVGAMAAAASSLLGEHDFAAYCRRREGATTIRTLLRLTCVRGADGHLEIEVEADAFCHQMVRSLVGALVAVGEGRRDPAWPASLLAAAAREPAVMVMPAHGLTLEEVRYPPDDQLLARTTETRAVRRPVGDPNGTAAESGAHWDG